MAVNERLDPGRSFATRVSAPLVGVFLLACFAMVGCGESDDAVAPPPDPPRAATISVSPPTASLSFVGETVAFQATVTDQYGAPFSGSVVWASSAPQAFTVSADGVVTAVANGSGTVTASVQGVSGSAAVLVEQLPSALAVVSGDGQNGRRARPLSQPLTVRVTDTGGTPVANVSVKFVPAEASGQVSRPTAVTDVAGQATTIWTLGDVFGTQTVVASINGGASAVLTATALRPEAFVDSIAVVSGDEQTARVATALREAIVLRVLDTQGLPVDGASILFDLPEGHGRVSPDSVTSDSTGEAATIWTLGDTAGIQTLTAAVVGGEVRAVITARAKSGLGVCDRTPQVREAIMAALGHSDCADVTEDRLESLQELDFGDSPTITSLYEDDFAGLHNLRFIRLAEHEIRELPDGVFRGLSRLRLLTLRENRIHQLAAGAFSELINLEVLDLRNNELTELPDGVFSMLPSLDRLELSFNQLGELPDSPFNGLRSLRYLDLYHNQLRELPERVFSGLRELRTLRLEYNRLGKLPVDPFADLINLERLDLRNNELGDLPVAVFSGLTKLESLGLSYNQLSELPPDPFSGLTNLKWLDLDENHLSALPVGLSELTELNRLDLRGNRISVVSADAFSNLANLQYLGLDKNDLAVLPIGVFAGLSSLDRLELHANELTELPAGIFAGLTNLKHLAIGRNRLTKVPPHAFFGLTSLRYLSLNTNQLSGLPVEAFSGLSNLESLILSGNQLDSLPAGVFSRVSDLTALGLGSNRLTELFAEVFSELPNLEEVSVRNNELTTLPADLFRNNTKLEAVFLDANQLDELPEGIFSGLPEMRWLWLQDNPGSPFSFGIELERTDTTDLAAPGPATLVATVSQGAPFEMQVQLSANGATLSSAILTILTGETRSSSVTVTANPGSAATVTLGNAPNAPETICSRVHGSDGVRLLRCYQGLVAISGKAITLFR